MRAPRWMFKALAQKTQRVLRRLAGGAALALGLSAGSVGAAEGDLAALGSPFEPVYAAQPQLLQGADGRMRLEMTLSQAVQIKSFDLTGPPRVVVDLPELTWMFRSGAPLGGADAEAGVLGVRVGLYKPGRSRLVVDLSRRAGRYDARVVQNAAGPGAPAKLVIELDFSAAAAPATAPAASSIMTASTRARTAQQPSIASISRPRTRKKVIVIDAGHGGRDPGAVVRGVREKDITLAAAKLLKARLQKMGRFDVHLTRETDVFIELEDRVARAQKVGADLFVSLHADALPGHPRMSGASVYTLSDSASDALADDLARSENLSSGQAGRGLAAEPSAIREIIVDYARRHVADESSQFADTVVASFKRRGVSVLKRRPHRQAGFVVLKSFSAPAVLVEMGFMTNASDRRRLSSPQWRAKAADAMADAIARWAAREPSAMRVTASDR